MCLKYTTYALAATKKGGKKKGEKKTRILLANRKCKSASPLPSFIPTLKSLFFFFFLMGKQNKYIKGPLKHTGYIQRKPGKQQKKGATKNNHPFKMNLTNL